MTTEMRALIVKALERFKGDCLLKADTSFVTWPDRVMDKDVYGNGETPNQTLARYRREAIDADAAITYITTTDDRLGGEE